jgi:hypothetical protein
VDLFPLMLRWLDVTSPVTLDGETDFAPATEPEPSPVGGAGD